MRFLVFIVVLSFPGFLQAQHSNPAPNGLFTLPLEKDVPLEENSDDILVPRQGDGRFGLIDRHGNVVLENKYSEILGFNNRRARVNMGGILDQYGRVLEGKWGYINKKGDEVIPLVYDEAWYFNEGLAPVKKNGQWFFIDTLGNVQAELDYDFVWPLMGGVAKVNNGGKVSIRGYVYGGKFGMIDRQGNIVIPLQGRYLEYPDGNYIREVYFKGNDGLRKGRTFDLKGNVIEPSDPEIIKRTYGDYIVISASEDPFLEAAADFEGNVLVPYSFKKVLSYGEGRAIGQDVSNQTSNVLSSIYLVADSLGHTHPIAFTKEQFDWPDTLLFRNAQLPLDEVSEDGFPFFTLFLDKAEPFQENFAVIKENYTPSFEGFPHPDGRQLSSKNIYGLVNRFGKVILFPVYQNIEVQGNMIIATHEFIDVDISPNNRYKEHHLLDTAGQSIFPEPFKQLQLISNNQAIGQTDAGWGMINVLGDTLIPFIYQELNPPNDGIILAKKDLRYGYIDTLGKELIPFRYRLARPFEEEITIVGEGRKWGYKDSSDQFVIHPQFFEARPFREGMAAVIDANEKWTFIGENGRRNYFAGFDQLSDFKKNFAWGQANGKYGLYKKEGNHIQQLIPPRFGYYSEFEKGFARVQDPQTKLWAYLREDGSFLTDFKYFQVSGFNDGFAEVGLGISGVARKGMIDITGVEIIPPEFSNISNLTDGLFRVTKRVNNKNTYGYYDTKGNVIAPPEFSILTNFENGRAVASYGQQKIYFYSIHGKREEFQGIGEGKTGILDISGRWIIPPEIIYLDDFKLGTARFAMLDTLLFESLWGIIDRQGNILLPPRYRYISVPTAYGISLALQFNEELGTETVNLIDRKGKSLSDKDYIRIQAIEKGFFLATHYSGKIGLFDKFGNQILASEYAGIEFLPADQSGNRLLRVTHLNGKRELAQLDGTLLGDQFDQIYPASEGLYRIEKEGQQGFINEFSVLEITPTFQDARDFKNGYAAVKKGGKWGMINRRGKIALPCQFRAVKDFSGAFIAKNEKGWCIVNKRGKQKTVDNYTYISDFEFDYTKAFKGNTAGLLNKKGKLIHPVTITWVDNISKYDDAYGMARIRTEKGMGLIDKNGKIVIPPVYSLVNSDSRLGTIAVNNGWWGKPDSKNGYYDLEGNVILPVQYFRLRTLPKKEMFVASLEETGNYSYNQRGIYHLYFKQEKEWSRIPGTYTLYREIPTLGSEKNADHLLIVQEQSSEMMQIIDREGNPISKKYTYIDWEQTRKGFIPVSLTEQTISENQDTTESILYGLINFKGEEVVPLSPNIVNDYSSALGGFRITMPEDATEYYSVGVYNITHSFYIPPGQFSRIDDAFSNGLVAVRDTKMKDDSFFPWGYYSPIQKKVMIPLEYRSTRPFSEGLAFVNNNETWLVIDTLGNEFIPEVKFESLRSKLDEEHFEAVLSDYSQDLTGIVNRKGEVVIPFKYSNVIDFRNGYAVVNNNGEYGLIPYLGNSTQGYNQNLFEGIIGGVWGIVDSTGREVVSLDEGYDKVYNFEGEYAAAKKNGKWGLLDKAGNVYIDFQFDQFLGFEEGFAVVKTDRRFNYIDKEGNFLASNSFENARSFKNGLGGFQLNNKWGYINSEGKIKIKPKYDFLADFSGIFSMGNFGGAMTENAYSYIFSGGITDIVRDTFSELDFTLERDVMLLKKTEEYMSFPFGKNNKVFVEPMLFFGQKTLESLKASGYRLPPDAKEKDLRITPHYYLFVVGYAADVRNTFVPMGTDILPPDQLELSFLAYPLDDYDGLQHFSDEATIVQKDGLFGLISNTTGEELLKPLYEEIGPQSNGESRVRRPNYGGTFYINSSGRCVRNCEYLIEE